jgi:acyl-coenzyme A thioesterase PaaI-like protein
VDSRSLQEIYGPHTVCFGCGPDNEHGLHVRSFPEGDDACVCRWRPEPYHLAFPNVLNGGICGAVLDCHSNWTAAWHLMRLAGSAQPPCTVTAELSIALKRPTPLDAELLVRAKVASAQADRVTIDAHIEVAGRVTATCRGLFVAVPEGHPAFHRWGL